jgi:ribonuclease BN (tRNA processing enzyme)
MGEEDKKPAFLSMHSQIIFLGTGSGKYVRGKQLRRTGGIIVQAIGNQLHIDPGPGALVTAHEYGINPRENTAILVTHNHLGHANDVNALVDATTYGGTDQQGVLIASKTVINGEDKYRAFLHPFYSSLLEKVISVGKGQRVGVNEVEILATQANHTDKNAVGFKIFTPEFVLGYTGDTEYTPGLVEQYKGCDILILNVVNPQNIREGANLCAEDAVTIISKTKPKLAIITHFNLKMLQSDPIYEAREIQKNTGIQVIAAKDGMTISPGSYAAKVSRRP